MCIVQVNRALADVAGARRSVSQLCRLATVGGDRQAFLLGLCGMTFQRGASMRSGL